MPEMQFRNTNGPTRARPAILRCRDCHGSAAHVQAGDTITAGTQILMRYVKDYAIPYAEKKTTPNAIPRAAYAVYNAGPRAVGRFDKQKPHPREARVDEKLWTLYQGIAAGGHADLKSCGVRNPS